MIVDKDLYILFLENRLKEVKLLHTNEIEENERLKAEIDKAENFRQCMYNDMDAEVRELNEEIKKCWCGGNDDVKVELNALREQELDLIMDKDKLKAEIKELKRDIKHDAKVCEDYDDGLIEEIKELKAENIVLKVAIENNNTKIDNV